MAEEMRNVIIELSGSTRLGTFAAAMAAGAAPQLDTDLVPALEGIRWDPLYPPVQVPAMTPIEDSEDPQDVSARFSLDDRPEAATYLVRGEVPADRAEAFAEEASRSEGVVGVYADVAIEVCRICPGDPPLGTDRDVERLLCAERLRASRMDGRGVMVAVVDTGINMAYLNAHGKTPNFNAARSWAPLGGGTPGSQPVGHGTMCAYDVCIAAPRCTLLDISLLLSTRTGGSIMEGLLSDAVLAYRHLMNVMSAPRRPGESRSLVVNNSWGMFHPTWDFPVGHIGNYSDNPNHPFNRIVGALELMGADILFAAGNCGRDCPDGRCRGVTTRAIYGANSHPQVLCVAGVDVTGDRVGYSSIGPGRLSRQKPDLAGFTHFQGSGVYAADGGTSAATPVVAGVVAALRTRLGYHPLIARTHPAAVRNLLRKTAFDRGLTGYDFEYGWGIINGCVLPRVVRPAFEAAEEAVAALEKEILATSARDYDLRELPAPEEEPVPVRAR